jgi:hypothetical protein
MIAMLVLLIPAALLLDVSIPKEIVMITTNVPTTIATQLLDVM